MISSLYLQLLTLNSVKIAGCERYEYDYPDYPASESPMASNVRLARSDAIRRHPVLAVARWE